MRRRRGRPGLVGTMARTAVIAGTATAVSGSIQQKQQAGAARAQAEQEAAQAPRPPPPPPPAPAVPQDAPPATGSGDLMDQLERLGSLKTSGLLSDEEFSAAKAQLLGL